MMGSVDGWDARIKEREDSRMSPRCWLKPRVVSDVMSEMGEPGVG